jgi:penicillin-binding protein 2
MSFSLNLKRAATAVLALAFFAANGLGATQNRKATKSKSTQSKTTRKASTAKSGKKKTRVRVTTVTVRRRTHAHRLNINGMVPVRGARVASGPWTSPTYADSTAGDSVDGEDLVVRRAAVEALGNYNGTVVVVDPQTGRVLTMVNQRIALGNGFQPCSTIKVMTALAGLSEGTVDNTSAMRVYRRTTMNLTSAFAVSNNIFFANVGRQLGYDRINYYGRLFGYGERAGLNIEGEQPGIWPDEEPSNGGVGMMTSFGEGISQTPLQLAALMSAIANGGTLYYLQYPKTHAEAASFAPRDKRRLPIQNLIEELKPGMMGAVEFGTARRANYDANEPIFGKTGTCTDSNSPTHLGWFASFNEVNNRKLVVVVLLTGGSPVKGPVAAGVAGQVYRNLSAQNYYTTRPVPPVALVSPTTW